MAKASREAAREKAAALRAEAARKDRQRKQLVFLGVGLAVLLIVVAVAFAVSQGQSKKPATTTSSAFIGTITALPAATFDKAGAPATPNPVLKKVGGPELTQDGKPRVVYVGGEFCPYCAVERWSLVAALSRFGTFEGLEPTTSADNDGNIPTVTFAKAKYTSDVLAFTAYETSDRDHQPLQALPDDISKLMKDNGNTQGAVPWTWWGKWASLGAPVDIALFTGGGATANVTHDQVATAMAEASDGLGKALDGQANEMTAQICALTGDKPATVCDSAAVKASAAVLPK